MFKSKKNTILLITAVFLLCGCLYALMLFVEHFGVSERITGLQLQQIDDAIYASWDETSMDGYEIRIETDRGDSWLESSKGSIHKIKNIEPGVTYTITVRGTMGNDLSMDDYGTITAKKTQNLTISNEFLEGFAGDSIRLDASAEGDIFCQSTDNHIASETKAREITLKNPGKAKIMVSAAETDKFASSARVLKVVVYPDNLKAPSIRILKQASSQVTFKWKKSDFAMQYNLKRFNKVTNKYETIEQFDSKVNSASIGRIPGKYAIEATATVGEKTISSPLIHTVSVSNPVDNASTYSSFHNLSTLNSSTLEKVATISGSGSLTVPQSMCCTKDRYNVTYIRSKTSTARIMSYDKNGNFIEAGPVSSLGHCNGTTYNPNTGKIYTVHAHKGVNSRTCVTLSSSSLSKSTSFTLPRVTSGIAYDETNNKYYLTKGNEIYVTDSDFNVEKFIWKKIRYNHAQDCGAYNGVVLVCTWVNGNNSYIDCYRASDGKYLGGYHIPIGEIESCCVDDGYLVLLINHHGTRNDGIYKTKKRIAFE